MGLTSFTITLSDEMAQLVKDKVASGEYESESEVFCDALRELDPCVLDDAMLLAQIKPAYEAYLKNPESARPIDEVFAGIEARYDARKGQPPRR